jgi:Protein of unknown function (DUF2909)
MKWFLIAAFIAIGISLASAGYFLINDGGKDANRAQKGKKRMAWALTWRIGMSVAVFLTIWTFYLLGWIKPTGLPIGAMQ